MKHIITLLFLTLIGLASYSQSTSPRFGTTPNSDNTGRVLTYKILSLTDASGVDSIAITPNAFQTICKVTLTDTLTLKNPVVTTSYYGDQIIIIATAASGTPRLKFAGSNWVSQGAATLSTGLRAVIQFVFDGAKWIEAGRVVQ